MKRALTPGTFDPITEGHLDVIRRAAQLVDEVIVAVAVSAGKGPKGPLFSLEERVALAREATRDIPGVMVEPFDELLVDFARRMGAQAVVKGLRAITDFEYEFQQALTNKKLNPSLETMFLSTSAEHMFLSSSMVKQVAGFGGDISHFVPGCILETIRERLCAE